MRTPRTTNASGITMVCGAVAATALTAFLAGCSGSKEPVTTSGGGGDGRFASATTDVSRTATLPQGESQGLTGSGGSLTGAPGSIAQMSPDPSETKAAWREGVARYDARDYQTASERLGVAAAGRPSDPYVQYLYGLSLWKSGNTEMAEDVLGHAAELASGSVKTWTNLA